MTHVTFRKNFKDFLLALGYPALFVVSMALLVLFSAGCSREDSPSSKVGKKGAITFTATGGNSSAATKSSADALSAGASLSLGTSALTSAGGNSVEAERTYQIYYDFDKGENVDAPNGGLPSGLNGSPYDAEGNLTQSSDTRFSGEIFTVSTGNRERINWVAGDKITIFECGSGEYSNYSVKTVKSSSDEKSTASLVPVTGNGLQWHDGSDHKFVALYPSIDDLGISSPTVTYDGSSSPYSATINGFHTVIYHQQYCRKAGTRKYAGRDENWYEPDMNYARMLSSLEVEASKVPSEDVSLSFIPQFSSVEVKLFKPEEYKDNTVKLVRARLVGGSGDASATDLVGSPKLTLRGRAADFATKLASDGTITYSGGNSISVNYIYMYFKNTDGTTDMEPELEKYSPTANPLSFTFLTFPSEDITQLELQLVISVDGVKFSRTLKLKDGSGWIPLPAGKKLTITNMQSAVTDITPFTIEPIETGKTTITIKNPAHNAAYSYSINGGPKVVSDNSVSTITIEAEQGDKVALYQRNGAISLGGSSSNPSGLIHFDKPCYVYGNILSLQTEFDYPDRKAVGAHAFRDLFRGNTNLRNHPTEKLRLPATEASNLCYSYMFAGCTGLTEAPELPATKVGTSSYSNMFLNCTGLTEAPALPATTLGEYCYQHMFDGCTGLTVAPELPASTLPMRCYAAMFENCTNLETPPSSIGTSYTTLGENSCDRMFFNCEKLATAPALPATKLALRCYRWMFEGCTSLKDAPELPATTLAEECYSFMFRYCTSLENAPSALPATELKDLCYNHMFDSCLVLNPVPADYLKATEMKARCYNYMFKDCHNLSTAPELPATKLAEMCYSYMFYGCQTLSSVPDLPATKMERLCYNHMFQKCIGLTSVPTDYLKSTDLAVRCYNHMFANCANLANAPELPAMILADSCYAGMFWGTALEIAPELPATTLAPSCYQSMFTELNSSNFLPPPALPATTMETNCYRYMFGYCNSLTSLPEDYLPATTLADSCYRSMFYGCSNLQNAPKLTAETMFPACYRTMFTYCNRLNAAPELPATILADSCYKSMFYGCSNLQNAPDLPATDLKTGCYFEMFRNCGGLASAPYLPATTAAPGCYFEMFLNCTKLSEVKCNLTDRSATNCTTDWLLNAGTASSVTTRTFYKNASVTWPTSDSGIPTGWTVEDITHSSNERWGVEDL